VIPALSLGASTGRQLSISRSTRHGDDGEYMHLVGSQHAESRTEERRALLRRRTAASAFLQHLLLSPGGTDALVAGNWELKPF
jgi:hypothetical protein